MIRLVVAVWILFALAAAAPYTTRFMHKKWLAQMCAAPYSKADEYRLRHCIALHRLVLDR